MIPQLITAVWLTLTAVCLGHWMYLGSNTKSAEDTTAGTVVVLIYITIPVLALYFAGFWSVNI